MKIHGKDICTHEVRFVERRNGRMHNVEIFDLQEFADKFARIQNIAIDKPWYVRILPNYTKNVYYETRHKFMVWFFDRLSRNLNRS